MKRIDWKVFWHLMGEIGGASLVLMIFWDAIMEKMFGLPNMGLFQACCVVVLFKALRHWI